MKKRILVVDDESFFASIFLSNFDWEQYGFFTPIHAESGQRAIELLQQQSFTLAFVDMSMPTMSGPQLIAYISEHFPATVCIALSNYDDFNFVKESFRAGAKDYILKHCLNRQELIPLLRKYGAAEPLPAPKPAANGESAAAIYLTQTLHGMSLQSGGDPLAASLGIPPLSRNILLMRLVIEDYARFRQKYAQDGKLPYILKNICSIMQNVLDRHCSGVVFFSPEDDCVYSLLSSDQFSSVPTLKHTRELYSRQVKNSLLLYFNLHTDTVFAPLCANIRDIYYAYCDIQRQLHLPVPARAQNAVQLDQDRLYSDAISTLTRCLRAPSFERARRFLALQYENGWRLNYQTAQFVELTLVLFRVWLQCVQELLGPDAPAQPDSVSRIFAMTKAQEMEQYMTGLFQTLQSRFQTGAAQRYSKHVQNALEIIHRQYQAPTLSLNLIAEMLHINASYLSRTFKAETNTGISEYINRYRIHQAQDSLLIDHVSVKEAAERCGFDNYTYFFRVFKQVSGVTPGEFCEMHALYPTK